VQIVPDQVENLETLGFFFLVLLLFLLFLVFVEVMHHFPASVFGALAYYSIFCVGQVCFHFASFF
jgi:hypothetical protein